MASHPSRAPVRRQVSLPSPPPRVWRALTDPTEAGTWLGGDLEWTVEEGAPVRFDSPESGRLRGRIETVRPGRYLRFYWWPVDGAGTGEDDSSEVTYLLEPEGDGTRLTVQERLHSPADPPHPTDDDPGDQLFDHWDHPVGRQGRRSPDHPADRIRPGSGLHGDAPGLPADTEASVAGLPGRGLPAGTAWDRSDDHRFRALASSRPLCGVS